MGYVRRNKNFWLPVVKDWQQSGKSQSEYAKKHNTGLIFPVEFDSQRFKNIVAWRDGSLSFKISTQ